MKAHVIKLGTTLLLACTALYGADPDAATLFRQAHTAYKQQNYPQALSLFRTMLEKYPDAKQAVRAWEYVAQCENALGNPMAAFEAYQKIWERHKDFSQLSVITRNQMKIGNYFLKNKQYKNAITVYEKILENAPHSDVAPGAQYSLAQAYLGEEDYSAARAELAKLIRNYPSSQLVDDAMFDLGYIAYVESKDAPYDQAATSEAIAAFRSFISNFPSSPKVPEAQQYIRLLRSRKAAALFRTAEFYENVRVPKAAQITYREVIEQYPDTPYADEARRRLEGAGRQTISEQLPPPRAAAVFSEDTETARTREASAVAAAPLAAPTPVTPITVRPATTAPGVPAHTPATDTLRNLSARRVAQLKNDPKGREVLRTTMKQAYMEELRRARATKAAWRAQQASRRSGSPSPAPQPLAPAQPASPTVASARAQTPPTRQPIAPPLTSATQPQDEDFAFEVRSQEAPIDVAAEPQAQAPQTHTSEQPATTAPRRSTPRMIVEYERSSPPPQPTTTTPSSSPTVPIEGPSFDDILAGRAHDETPAPSVPPSDWQPFPSQSPSAQHATQPPLPAASTSDFIVLGVEPLDAPRTSASVTASLASPISDRTASTVPQPASQPPQLSPAPQKPSTPPSDFIVLGTESLASTSRPPRLAAASPSAPTSPPPASAAQASTISPPPSSPEPPATSSQSTPAAEPPELARARREEQSRAAATRRRVEAIREQADRDELTTRQFSTEGRVRRAQYDQPTTEASQTPFNNEQLQREYAGIYYLIKRGDAALQQGLHTEAKQHYGNALDRLLKIKEKAPTWQSDIVNYRIDYCRERLRSVQ